MDCAHSIIGLKNKWTVTMNKSTALIVLTCDNYSDLWPMFIEFSEKYWPDCPYDKYFITNNKEIPESSFNSIKIGKDDSWSDGLLRAIVELKPKYDYLLITLEDSPLIDYVDQNKLNVITDAFLSAKGNFLSLFTQHNMGKPTRKFNEYFGIIDKGSLYRPTCVYSLWKISVLEDLLIREENAWDFERYGSVRSDKYDDFFMVYNNFFIMSNTVIKGKWLRSEYKKIKKLGYKPNIIDRELMSMKEEFFLKTYTLIFIILNKYVPIPWKIRRRVIFKLKGYKYVETIANEFKGQ
jgi:hypothetical protein